MERKERGREGGRKTVMMVRSKGGKVDGQGMRKGDRGEGH